ncbi:hypothetical protein FPV67DRAFT_1675551 [Lyophyllum atratum]|nr:hypothetical protein FPV67DRAFT_1675551 [Lyophyllum atratum]
MFLTLNHDNQGSYLLSQAREIVFQQALHVGTNRKALRSEAIGRCTQKSPRVQGHESKAADCTGAREVSECTGAREAADCTGALEVLDCTEATELDDMEALERGTERKPERKICHGHICVTTIDILLERRDDGRVVKFGLLMDALR